MEGPVKPTLALIDDSDDVRALVRTRLQLSGEFELIGEGRDGSEAISLAYRQEPDLMVLDISMPDMDGLEALPAILALSPDTRVVMFTGFEERVLAVLVASIRDELVEDVGVAAQRQQVLGHRQNDTARKAIEQEVADVPRDGFRKAR